MKKAKTVILRMFGLILSVIMTVSLVACGGKQDNGKDGEKSDVDATLTISYTAVTDIANFTRFARAFEKKKADEGVTVEVKTMQISGGYNEALTKYYNAGTMPDVVYTQDATFVYWAEQGIFEKLDSYFETAKDDLSAYDENAFNSGRLQDGNLYFVPRSCDQPVIFVNKAYFEKYGVEVPQAGDDWTWTKLIETTKALRTAIDAKEGAKATQHKPLDINFTWAPIYNSFIRSFGGYVYNPDTNTVGFTDKNTVKAIEKIRELTKAALISSATEGAGAHFSNGTAGMYVASRPYASELEDYGIESVAFLPMPKMDAEFCGNSNPISYYSHGANGFALYSGSKQKELAFEFLQFLLTEEGQSIDAASGSSVPVLNSLKEADNATWKTGVEFLAEVNQDAFYVQDGYTYILSTYARNNKGIDEYSIYSQVTTLMNSVSASTYRTAEDFCKFAQSQVEKYIK